MTSWFSVDKKGLRNLAKERGADKIFVELISNALDEAGVTKIEVSVLPVPNKSLAAFSVKDNSPVGFRDLAHAHTLFAESYKRNNPEQRGQFNFGEKLFLSLCREAKIQTTTGTTIFNDDGRQDLPRQKTVSGTIISGNFEITRDEYESLVRLMDELLLPPEITVIFNDHNLPVRVPVSTLDASLPTKIADNDGVMKQTVRKTKVTVFDVLPGETPFIYEMGIPVVESDCRWHINVGQRVILNKDRDNVSPAYKRAVFTLVAETMREKLNQNDANGWANVVLEDQNASPEVINKLMDEKFGKKRASFDPSDPESSCRGMSEGYTIVSGRSLSAEQWENVRRSEAIKSSGTYWPTPKPYSDNPLADVAEEVTDLSSGMELVRDYAVMLAKELMNINLSVRFVKAPDNKFAACYARGGSLDFNVSSLGRKWFDDGIDEEVDELLIHEFGHEFESSHLSSNYYDALCRLGAKLKKLALEKPTLFGARNARSTKDSQNY